MSNIVPFEQQMTLRPIPGYEGRYSAGSDGRIWSEPREWRGGNGGRCMQRHDGRWLRPCTTRHGYQQVVLCDGSGKAKCYVHRLVALAWLPNPQGLPQVNHKNGRKQDNCAENLEWCTASANRLHGIAHGLVTVTDEMREASRRNITAHNRRRRA